MEHKFYLYGAGQNAWALIKFLGRENILGLMDSAEEKIGSKQDGLEVHDLSWYLKQETKQKHHIVISAFAKSEEIINMLHSKGIDNILDAPNILSGMLSIEEIAEHIVQQKRNIIFDNTTLLSFLLASQLIKTGKKEIIKGFLKIDNRTAAEELRIEHTVSPEVNDITVLTKSDTDFMQSSSISCINVLNYIYFNPQFANPKLVKYKDLYKGRRCFVIGNGPSLRMDDLDRLADNNEICFASNGIYLAFQKTKWRPTYMAVVDFNGLLSHYSSLSKMENNITLFVKDFYPDGNLPPLQGTELLNVVPYNKNHPYFSDDITRAVHSGLTVSYVLFQLAAYMGFSEIFLLGMDCTFAVGGNHFSEKYDSLEKGSINKFTNYTEDQIEAYKVAEKYSRSHGFHIYNATRGGALEVFERVDFDSLF